jgi:hypothetical protein
MERGPKIRVVGKGSDEKKEQAKREIIQALFNHFQSLSPGEQKLLRKFEYPKSEIELALINFANKETSILMQEAGLEPYDIPPENYHLIPPDIYERFAGETGSRGLASHTKQGVLLNAKYLRNNPVYFGSTVLHETLHLKSHFSVKLKEKNDVEHYRVGISSFGYRGGEHEHFRGLHEAIIAETQKRLLKKMLELPELEKEKNWLESDEAKAAKKKLAEEKQIAEDDIIWIDKNDINDWQAIEYSEQRAVLAYLCSEIQKEFSEQYKNPDDVYKLFLKAHFTGRLLEIAKLVEKTFGKGSFRMLGNMTDDPQSGILHLESLRKARMRQIKEKN